MHICGLEMPVYGPERLDYMQVVGSKSFLGKSIGKMFRRSASSSIFRAFKTCCLANYRGVAARCVRVRSISSASDLLLFLPYRMFGTEAGLKPQNLRLQETWCGSQISPSIYGKLSLLGLVERFLYKALQKDYRYDKDNRSRLTNRPCKSGLTGVPAASY